MSISHDFEYCKPATLNKALNILDKHNDKARILAGGTDLLLRIKECIDTPDLLVDIKGIREVNRLTYKNKILFIGANITFTELIESKTIQKHFPLLAEASATVASVGTRNRATLAGNICSAVPSLDSAPALLVYNAEIIVKSKNDERRISIHDWFVAPKKTTLKSNEIVVGININALPNHGFCYMKLGRYAGEDLAQAGIGILALSGNEYRIAYCAVGPVPKRSAMIENLLSGKELNDNLIKQAQEISESEISPITDIRASKEYRIHIIKVMLEKGLIKAKEKLK